jgi:hypothetical protein
MKKDVMHTFTAGNWRKHKTMFPVTSEYLALQWNKTGMMSSRPEKLNGMGYTESSSPHIHTTSDWWNLPA